MIATMEQIKEMENNQKTLTNTKFTINAETMKGIQKVYKGHKNASIPILNYIIIEVVNKNVINVKYSDADLFVEKMFFANVESIVKKEFVLPIDFFKNVKYIKKNENFVFEQANEDIMIFTRNNLQQKIQLESIENHLSFSFLEENEFKQIETSNGYEYFEYNDLKVLEKAIKSVSKSETRPALREISINNGQVVSTDSHRLFTSKSVFKLEEGFLINPALVQKAIDICDKNMFLKMSVNDHRIKIQDDFSTKIYFNHHQGNYPDTSRLMPIEFNYELEIDMVNELYNFAKSLKKENIELTFKVNEGKINLESQMSNATCNIDIPVRFNKIENDNFKIMFSALYLKDALEQIDKEAFTLKLVNNLRPFILEKQKNKKETVLLLPIRKK